MSTTTARLYSFFPCKSLYNAVQKPWFYGHFTEAWRPSTGTRDSSPVLPSTKTHILNYWLFQTPHPANRIEIWTWSKVETQYNPGVAQPFGSQANSTVVQEKCRLGTLGIHAERLFSCRFAANRLVTYCRTPKRLRPCAFSQCPTPRQLSTALPDSLSSSARSFLL